MRCFGKGVPATGNAHIYMAAREGVYADSDQEGRAEYPYRG